MQETGLDTVDANRGLGLPDDCREYTSVTNILANLGVKSIHLMVGQAHQVCV
jgi:GTP cyclohydrolase II